MRFIHSCIRGVTPTRTDRIARALDEMRARVVVFSPTRASGTRAR